jgi:hypothetical protein
MYPKRLVERGKRKVQNNNSKSKYKKRLLIETSITEERYKLAVIPAKAGIQE